jgi:hypothetical protein
LLIGISSGRRTKVAKQHLKVVGELLAKVDPHLTELAKNSKPGIASKSAVITKKRKGDGMDGSQQQVPKKKNVKSYDHSDAPSLSQREEIAMKNLIQHVEECGGELTIRLFAHIDARGTNSFSIDLPPRHCR